MDSSEPRLASHFVGHLGIESVRMDDGYAELALNICRQHLNSGGVIHGGVLGSLIDSAAGMAAFSTLPLEKMAVTTDLHMTCLRGVGQGRIIGRGELVHRGRRFMRADVELLCEDRLIAKGSVSFMVIDRPTPVRLEKEN